MRTKLFVSMVFPLLCFVSLCIGSDCHESGQPYISLQASEFISDGQPLLAEFHPVIHWTNVKVRLGRLGFRMEHRGTFVLPDRLAQLATRSSFSHNGQIELFFEIASSIVSGTRDTGENRTAFCRGQRLVIQSGFCEFRERIEQYLIPYSHAQRFRKCRSPGVFLT